MARNKKPIRKASKKGYKKEKLQPKAETYPHFRHYKKSGHPALITAEHSATEYQYRKVTHSEREGRHLNECVYPNPDPDDKKPMYIVRRTRHDDKANFSKWKYSWKYPKK